MIRIQLGGSGILADPFPAKPKGMHRRTYQRLFGKSMALEQAFLGGIAGWLNKFDGRFGN
jgi:hypothetical protein